MRVRDRAFFLGGGGSLAEPAAELVPRAAVDGRPPAAALHRGARLDRPGAANTDGWTDSDVDIGVYRDMGIGVSIWI